MSVDVIVEDDGPEELSFEEFCSRYVAMPNGVPLKPNAAQQHVWDTMLRMHAEGKPIRIFHPKAPRVSFRITVEDT